MEATKDIVSRPATAESRVEDEGGREPLDDQLLRSVDNLLVEGPRDVVGKEKLYDLAMSVGLQDVVRWKPRLVRSFLRSFGIFDLSFADVPVKNTAK